jgi:hypothetical protein
MFLSILQTLMVFQPGNGSICSAIAVSTKVYLTNHFSEQVHPDFARSAERP